MDVEQEIQTARTALKNALNKVTTFLEDNPEKAVPGNFADNARVLKRCVNLITCGDARLSIDIQKCGTKPIRSMWRQLNKPCFKCRTGIDSDVSVPALLTTWLAWHNRDPEPIATYTAKDVPNSNNKCVWAFEEGKVLASNPFRGFKSDGKPVTWLDIWSPGGDDYLLLSVLPLKSGLPTVLSTGTALPFKSQDNPDKSAVRRLTRSADGMVRPSPHAWGATIYGSRSVGNMCLASKMLNVMRTGQVVLVSQGYDTSKDKATNVWYVASGCDSRRSFKKSFRAGSYKDLVQKAREFASNDIRLAVWMPVNLSGDPSVLRNNFSPTSVNSGVVRINRSAPESTIRLYNPPNV